MTILKLLLSALLFLCLADMPYGYYQFVRVAAMIGFSVLAYKAREDGNGTEMIVYIGLAALFQPFVKVALGREMWNMVDVIVGVGLIWSVLKNKK